MNKIQQLEERIKEIEEKEKTTLPQHIIYLTILIGAVGGIGFLFLLIPGSRLPNQPTLASLLSDNNMTMTCSEYLQKDVIAYNITYEVFKDNQIIGSGNQVVIQGKMFTYEFIPQREGTLIRTEIYNQTKVIIQQNDECIKWEITRK